MYEKMERARREESQLLELTSAISSELKLDTLLLKIVNFTTEMLDADRSSLFMYDPETDDGSSSELGPACLSVTNSMVCVCVCVCFSLASPR